MKLFLKILTVSVLLAYLIASFVIWGNEDRRVRCEHFYVAVTDSLECNLVQADDIYRYIEQAGLSPIGKSCLLLNTEDIERHVRNIDLLTDVQCYHKRNGDVFLNVAQRRPVMRVVTDENDTYYVDDKVCRIEVDTMYLDYLPLVMGCIDDTVTTKDLIPLVKYISAHEFWSAQVDQIYVSPRHEILLYPRVGNHVILLGSLDKYEDKLARVLALYQQVFPRIGCRYMIPFRSNMKRE